MSLTRHAWVLVSLCVAAGCKKKDVAQDQSAAPAAASGSATASGSAGSAVASGSAVGSATGSDQAAAGSAGSGSGSGSGLGSGSGSAAEAAPVPETMHLYMDEHDLGAGKVKAADVAAIHKKDLANEAKHHVHFKAYWVDQKAGKFYCLAEAPSPQAITDTHKDSGGDALAPAKVLPVVAAADPSPIKLDKGMHLYLDVHQLGAGKVTPEAVADAHKKDLAVERKHKVSFLDYWVDPDAGTVMCLAEAPSAAAAIATHKEAHGLVPKSMDEVTQGGI